MHCIFMQNIEKTFNYHNEKKQMFYKSFFRKEKIFSQRDNSFSFLARLE